MIGGIGRKGAEGRLAAHLSLALDGVAIGDAERQADGEIGVEPRVEPGCKAALDALEAAAGGVRPIVGKRQ